MTDRAQKRGERTADSGDSNNRWITSLSAIPPSFKTAFSSVLFLVPPLLFVIVFHLRNKPKKQNGSRLQVCTAGRQIVSKKLGEKSAKVLAVAIATTSLQRKIPDASDHTLRSDQGQPQGEAFAQFVLDQILATKYRVISILGKGGMPDQRIQLIPER